VERRFPNEETPMKCVICRHGETRDGLTTVTFGRDGFTLVFRGVPARVCGTCGEAYVDEAVARRLSEEFEATAAEGRVVDVRNFQAA
jgi:YgiT-type zinc finger domain-containing protein